MARRDIAVPLWCVCGNCCRTSKAEEDVCCGQKQACRREDFEHYLQNKLTKDYLLDKLSEDPSKESKLSDIGLSKSGILRRLCYEKASAFFHKEKWYPQNDTKDPKYVALPSCIVWTIRRQYEEEEFGEYTGFPPRDELLQNVVEAQEKFKDKMKESKIITDLTNPESGLLQMLQKFGGDNVYGMLTQHIDDLGSRARQVKKWEDSISKCKQLLPKHIFVACAATFEAFVEEAIRRCVDTLFPTRTIREGDEQYWTEEFKGWLKTRKNEAKHFNDKEHEAERSFWHEIIPTLFSTTKAQSMEMKDDSGVSSYQLCPQSPKQRTYDVIKKLHENADEVICEIRKKRQLQPLVGLLQEIVNAKKQMIMDKLLRPTWDCINDTFTKLITECSKVRKLVQVGQQEQPSVILTPNVQVIEEEQSSSLAPSPSPPKQSRKSVEHTPTNVASRHNQMQRRRRNRSKRRVTNIPKQQTPQTSTPSAPTKRTLFPEDDEDQSIKKLCERYTNMNTWNIYLDTDINRPEISDTVTKYNVKCKKSDNLKYLSDLFYGLRCLFSHGTPKKTLETGCLSRDRTPSKSSHFGLEAVDTENQDPLKTQEICEAYLYHIATDASKKASEMNVNYCLSLTAHSFYTYMAKIIGSVGACVVYKYSDSRLLERSTTAHQLEL